MLLQRWSLTAICLVPRGRGLRRTLGRQLLEDLGDRAARDAEVGRDPVRGLAPAQPLLHLRPALGTGSRPVDPLEAAGAGHSVRIIAASWRCQVAAGRATVGAARSAPGQLI